MYCDLPRSRASAATGRRSPKGRRTVAGGVRVLRLQLACRRQVCPRGHRRPCACGHPEDRLTAGLRASRSKLKPTALRAVRGARRGEVRPEGLTDSSRGRPKGAPGRRPQRSQPRRGGGEERVDHMTAAIFSLAPLGLFWSGTLAGGSARIAFGDPRSTPGYSPRPLRGRMRQPCLGMFEGPAA